MRNQRIQASAFEMTDKSYSFFRNLTQYYLPASGTLYFALASIWGLAYGEQILGTIAAVNIFLGVILGISTKMYNAGPNKYDGALVVNDIDPHIDTYSLEMMGPLEDLKDKSQITLKIANAKINESQV